MAYQKIANRNVSDLPQHEYGYVIDGRVIECTFEEQNIATDKGSKRLIVIHYFYIQLIF